jgi:hypothetical protein
MRVSLNDETAEAIVSELASSAPVWRHRYFPNLVRRPLAIAFAFRDPVPSGASDFLVTISRLITEGFGAQDSRINRDLAWASNRSADVRVSFWPEVGDSGDGVGYEVEFADHGVQEIGWFAIP